VSGDTNPRTVSLGNSFINCIAEIFEHSSIVEITQNHLFPVACDKQLVSSKKAKKEVK
jgi:hypothetical protein